MLHENEQSGLAPSSSSWSLLFSWGPANMAEASTTSSSASSSFVYDIIPKVALSEGSVILGVPIRKDSFVEKGWMRRSRNSKAQTLKSNVVKFLLRRTSFGACRVNHVLRSLQFRHGKAVASKSAAMFQHGLADAMGSELPDVNFISGRRGGLGFRNPDFVHGAAFLASHLGHAGEEEVDESFWSEFREA